MGVQFVFDGHAEWLTVGIIRNKGTSGLIQKIEWNVVQELSSCGGNPGKLNRLYFTETDLTRFPPAKTHTADTYYIGLREIIMIERVFFALPIMQLEQMKAVVCKYRFLGIYIMRTENMLLLQSTQRIGLKTQSWSILYPLTVRQILALTKSYTPVTTIPEEHNL